MFGSQVTSSKMVGFGDLSEKVSPGAGKENVPEEKVTVASSKDIDVWLSHLNLIH